MPDHSRPGFHPGLPIYNPDGVGNKEHGTWNDEHGGYYHYSMFYVRSSVIVPSEDRVLADG